MLMNEKQANQLFEQAISALRIGKAAEAERLLKRLDNAIPSNPGIIYYLGAAASLQGRKEQAVNIYERVTRLHPQFVEAYNNKGLDLINLGKHEEAIESFKTAINIRPDFIEAYLNLGSTLNDVGQYEEALQQFTNALKIRPNLSDALTNMGGSLNKLGRPQEALQVLLKAIEINPSDAKAHHILGRLYAGERKYSEAIFAHATALGLNPTSPWALGDLVHLKMRTCDWHDYEHYVKQVLKSIHNEQKTISPLALLGLPSSLSTQRLCANQCTRSEITTVTKQLTTSGKPNNRKIKIAYLSADFFNHATAYLTAELFELHDRSRFDVIGVCYGRPFADEMRLRLIDGFDQFLEVSDKSDQEVAELLRDMEIDIAIDLKGHTENNRMGILAYRPAPVQIHYLGYPGTLGTSFIDYLVADPVLIPLEMQKFYQEKIIYLPNSYQVNDRKRKIAAIDDCRADHDLPEEGFIFCCFNNNWKITPEVFDTWMNILQKVEGSVLWLFKDNDLAATNLIMEARARGIAKERLVFAERLSLDLHLARLKHADLFLDTFHCNAHTTASDALWAELPVLTKIGETYASRVAASLLEAIGLPQLITTSIAEYESLAVELASHPEKLKVLKHCLIDQKTSAPLFDTPRFAKHLEAAFEQSIERYQQGLAPDHIHILAS